MVSQSPIASVKLYRVSLPTRREHKWTGLTEPIGGYVLVRIADEDGLTGWGEAPVLKDWGGEFGRYFGETPGTTISVTSQYLAPAIRGCMPGEIAEIHARMDRAIKGFPYAKAALEIAAYDLAAKQCGLPVQRLLGGAVRRTILVTHSIGLIGFEEAEHEAAQAVREGIRTIKIKVGVEPVRAEGGAGNAHDVIQIAEGAQRRSCRSIRPSPAGSIAPWRWRRSPGR